MKLSIYPPIGLARIGNSPNFFIGPESFGSPGVEIQPNGTEVPVANFKDAQHRVKKQAARFRLFEEDASGDKRPFTPPQGATITWSVHLINKKAAITRSGEPPSSPAERPQLDPGGTGRVIDAGKQSIAGASSGPLNLNQGQFQGQNQTVTVSLGSLRTDREQSLLVIGADGISDSPDGTPIGSSFYQNPGWYDDVADGTVEAELRMPDGSTHVATGAWVIVAPPDFAPGTRGAVTLYDVVRQAGITGHGLTVPSQPSFFYEIRPLIFAAHQLRWVHEDAQWAMISTDWDRLGDPSAAQAQLRRTTRDQVLGIAELFENYSFRAQQRTYLEQWAQGNFVADGSGPAPLAPGAELSRAALEGAVGQGFYPGIEAGIVLSDPNLYADGAAFDFRINPAAVGPGDLTALMAQPWQADFLKCRGNWWPSQRPDIVFLPPAATQSREWARGIGSHRDLVDHVMQLGVVTAATNAAGTRVWVEFGRDPALP